MKTGARDTIADVYRDHGARIWRALYAYSGSAEHALSAVAAALAEARDEIETAVVAYGDAAERWEAFAVVPEQGFALLGQGRCLLERSRSEAVEVLQRARDIFTRCGMHPALEEADALLAKAITLGS